MGDRTNLVMILAGELLRKAEYLLTMGLHPSEVVLGYELARDRAIEELESESKFVLSSMCQLLTSFTVAELTARTLETPLTEESLILALRPTLASKQYGAEDLLAKLVAEAVLAVMPKEPKAVGLKTTSGGEGSASADLVLSHHSSMSTTFVWSRSWEED